VNGGELQFKITCVRSRFFRRGARLAPSRRLYLIPSCSLR